MKRIAAIALGVALVATPAFAGGGYGYHEWDEPPYGCTAPGACRLPGPGAYGYYGANGGNGYRPPPPPPVPVQPAWCSPRDMIFVPQFGKHMCKPVFVPRVQ